MTAVRGLKSVLILTVRLRTINQAIPFPSPVMDLFLLRVDRVTILIKAMCAYTNMTAVHGLN